MWVVVSQNFTLGHIQRLKMHFMKCLTQKEIHSLCGAVSHSPRERALFGLALATGLRAHELLALNVKDVIFAGNIRCILELRVFKKSPAAQTIMFSQGARRLIEALLLYKEQHRQPLEPEAPLFLSRLRRRLSLRELRYLFQVWQMRAGFGRHMTFHSLRHTACTNIYRATKDIRVTQQFARHASITSTAIYTHPTEEDLACAVELVPC
jgi:integrase/recombinase XerC